MKYHETKDYSFFLDKNHYVYDHKENEKSLDIYIKSKLHSSICPECGTESTTLHSTYHRKIQDTPIRCKQTFLHANVYKYYCENPNCKTKVFMEDLPFAKPSQVRSDALNVLILGISMFLSNEGASKVLALLGVQISNDSIQRLYNRMEFVDDPDVEAVGIDDVAIRKGQTYATAIYDLKDHHLIALLNGRDAVTLKEWLKSHKKIRLVARDRASAYASAINEILPDCVQVADRFHLLQNLLGYLKDIFKEEMPSSIYIRDGKVLDHAPEKILIEKKPNEEYLNSLNYDNTPPKNEDGSEREYDNKKHNLDSKQYTEQAKNRKKKQELILEIQEYWRSVENKRLKYVAEKFKIGLLTAKKYTHMTESEIKSLDSPRNYKKRESPMNDWLNVIFKMFDDGLSSEIIYYYIWRQPSFTESKYNLEKYIYLIGKNNFQNCSLVNPVYLMEKVFPPEITVLKRNDILKFVLTCNPKVKKDEQVGQYIDQIKEIYPVVARVEYIFKKFHATIMGTDLNKLEEFLCEFEGSEIKSFCNGIKKDIAPVKNAISYPISSGFVEGNNNKFKLLKRIVYGRSGLVNLTKKCKLAFLPKNKDFNLGSLL